MKLLLFILFIFIYLPNNFGQARNLIGTYKGFHSATTWEIVLNDTCTFICKANGHIGNIKIEGNYFISGDTLI